MQLLRTIEFSDHVFSFSLASLPVIDEIDTLKI